MLEAPVVVAAAVSSKALEGAVAVAQVQLTTATKPLKIDRKVNTLQTLATSTTSSLGSEVF